MSDGLHAELAHLTAAVAEACSTEGQLMNSLMEGCEDSLQTIHQAECNGVWIVWRGTQQDRISLEFFDSDAVAHGSDKGLEQVGDDLLRMSLTHSTEVLSVQRNVSKIVRAHEAGIAADVENQNESLDVLHGILDVDAHNLG